MSIAPPPRVCPVCGLPREADHLLRVVWRTSPWSGGQDPAKHEHHERWIAICADCASEAALFRVDYPRQLDAQKERAFRVVVLFGADLLVLLVVLFAGRNMLNDEHVSLKAIYGIGWFLLGILTVILAYWLLQLVQFELSGRQSWSGPWLERRLTSVLALPTGDQAPYWWKIDLHEGLETQERPQPMQPVTFSIGPGDY